MLTFDSVSGLFVCAAAEEGALLQQRRHLYRASQARFQVQDSVSGLFVCVVVQLFACVVVQLFVCVAVQLFVCVVKLFVLIVQEISNPEFVGEFLFC